MQTPDTRCYSRQVTAVSGWPTHSSSYYNCLLPPHLTFCGYSLCPQLIPGADRALLAISPIDAYDNSYHQHGNNDDISLMQGWDYDVSSDAIRMGRRRNGRLSLLSTSSGPNENA